MLSSSVEVESFLRLLRLKIDFFGILFLDDRSKNMWTLLELEITPKRRKEIVHSLEVEDYSQGPLEDRMHQVLPLWVFGKKINAREIYIKVSLGLENSSAVCMSFHVAEHPMTYPYKRIKP